MAQRSKKGEGEDTREKSQGAGEKWKGGKPQLQQGRGGALGKGEIKVKKEPGAQAVHLLTLPPRSPRPREGTHTA